MKKIIVFLCIIVVAASCKFKQEENLLNSNGSYARVVSQCMVTQGNGGNWPATIGWMSEQINQRILEAEKKGLENETGFFLGCMAGGSSGSVATNVYMSLLSNKHLFGSENPLRIFSYNQAIDVSKALKLIALSLDLNLSEWLNFWSGFVSAQVSSKVNNLGFMKSLARNVFKDESPKWWSGEVVDPNALIVDYALVILLAKEIRKEDLLISPEKRGIDTKAVSSFMRGNSLWDLAEVKNFASMPGESSAEHGGLSKYLEEVSGESGEIAKERIINKFGLFEYKARYLNGALRKSKDNVLKRTAEQPLKEGFCTITMAALYGDYGAVDKNQAPRYESLRPVVMCSKETIDIILSSALYQSHVKSSNKYASRFVFIEAKNSRTSIYPSIREPGLMEELVSHVDMANLEFVSFYDPMLDLQNPEGPSFKRLSFKNEKAFKYVAVAGGFPDRRITSWPMSYYLMEKNKKFNNLSEGYLSMFGKPDDRSTDKFDTSSIRNTFSSLAEEGAKNVNDWFSFQDEMCRIFSGALSSVKAKIETVAFNWDVTKLPAAQARKSHFLVTKAINATRLQIGSYRGESPEGQALVFDPNKDHLPVPAAGFSCAP